MLLNVAQTEGEEEYMMYTEKRAPDNARWRTSAHKVAKDAPIICQKLKAWNHISSREPIERKNRKMVRR